MASDVTSPGRSRATAVALILLVAGVVCAVIGVLRLRPVGTASFGWFAYAPLSQESMPTLLFPGVLAVTLIAVGMLFAGLGAGILLGRRTR
jgi:heme/copper-type cytochrome/quinol oxidase subunit 1